MKRIGFFLCAVLVPMIVCAEASGSGFSDLPQNSPFFVPVSYLQQQGMVGGYDDSTFRPETFINRAEALAIILHAVGGIAEPAPAVAAQTPTPPADSNPAKFFRDVQKNNWFYSVVKIGHEKGIVSGESAVGGGAGADIGAEGKYFRPGRTVTLAETLRMLFKTANVSWESFGSVSLDILPAGIPHDAWYAPDIAYALFESLLIQQEDGSIFSADQKLTRGQFATLMYRFLKHRSVASNFGYASWYADGASKVQLSQNVEFADRYLTAAHKTLPMGSLLRVTNMDNGKYVDVVINDRGPFVRGRLVDLSKSAFAQLASPGAGVILVEVRPISFDK